MFKNKTFWVVWIVTFVFMSGSFVYLSKVSAVYFPLNTKAETLLIPDKIIVDKVGIDVSVVNPNSEDIDLLTESLKIGSVRHPYSSKLGEKGNILIFAHSSNLDVLHNSNYKAFNDIESLEVGDEIKLKSGDTEFVYKVYKKELVKDLDKKIEFNKTDDYYLTLATCNQFGELDDRYVISAKLK